MEKEFKKSAIVKDERIETQTVYMESGAVNIYPCSFELGKHHIVEGAGAVSQKGRMVIEDNGTSHFTPYRTDTGEVYEYLFVTPHGELKKTKNNVIVRFKFSKKMNKRAMAQMLREEMQQILHYLLSRNNITIW